MAVVENLFDTPVTIYNACYNPQTRLTEQQATYLGVASCHYGNNARFSDAGLTLDSVHKVRLQKDPLPDGYLSSLEWKNTQQKGGKWPLQTGDTVTLGRVQEGVALQEAKRQYLSFTIDKVYDNRRGIKQLQHIRLEGK